jgi:hypothetical protein
VCQGNGVHAAKGNSVSILRCKISNYLLNDRFANKEFLRTGSVCSVLNESSLQSSADRHDSLITTLDQLVNTQISRPLELRVNGGFAMEDNEIPSGFTEFTPDPKIKSILVTGGAGFM